MREKNIPNAGDDDGSFFSPIRERFLVDLVLILRQREMTVI